MKEFAKRYNAYTAGISRFIRLGVLVALLIFLLTQLHEEIGLKISLFLLSVFFMNEIFFHFYLGKRVPSVPLSKQSDGQDIYESMTFAAARAMVAGSIPQMLSSLVRQPSVNEFIGKLGVSSDQLPKADLPLETVAMKARELVTELQAEFITPVDLMTAYLLLTEPTTKLLLNKKLQQADVMNVREWMRNTYAEEEHPQPTRVHFWGKGIGDDFVTGWTLETQKFTQDYTNFAVTHPPIIVGRDQELQLIKETLLKKENNNVLLIGESGVGKESLIQILANQSYMSMLDPKLNKRRVLEVLVNAFLAGAQGEGDLEARLQAIIEEVSHSGDIILYIPEFQNILGGSSYGVDIAGVLLPYLRKGNLPIIASMSQGHYKTFMQNNPLKDVFEVVHVDVPQKDAAIQMVLAKARELEASFPVVISYEAVVAAVTYANRYRPDDVLPGSAVILLEDTVQAVATGKKKVTITDEMVFQKVETVTHSKVGSPDAKETQLLLHLEDDLHKRVIGQNEAISALSEALRRLRANVTSQTRPVSFLFLGPTGVGKTETAKALADLYFQGQMIRLDMSEYADAEGMTRLLGSTYGDKRGELTEKIHDHPFSLVLLDEFEKASPDILNLFLQVLEDGRLTDNRGQTVSFVNAIIIATSNAGSEFIRESIQKGQQAGFQQQLLNLLQSKNIFRPELLNRFDGVIAFHPLEQAEIQQVVVLLLQAVSQRLKTQDISVGFTENVVKKVAQEGFDEQFGARPLRRFIESSIEDLLAKEILAGKLPRGSKIMLDCDVSGKLVITPSGQ